VCGVPADRMMASSLQTYTVYLPTVNKRFKDADLAAQGITSVATIIVGPGCCNVVELQHKATIGVRLFQHLNVCREKFILFTFIVD
jgi:hypothetical protein